MPNFIEVLSILSFFAAIGFGMYAVYANRKNAQTQKLANSIFSQTRASLEEARNCTKLAHQALAAMEELVHKAEFSDHSDGQQRADAVELRKKVTSAQCDTVAAERILRVIGHQMRGYSEGMFRSRDEEG